MTTGRTRTAGVTAAPKGGLALAEPNTGHDGPAWLTGARAGRRGLGRHARLPDPQGRGLALYAASSRSSPCPSSRRRAGLRYKRAPTAINGLGPGLGGARLVFVNGHFAPELSRCRGTCPRVRR